MITKIAIEEMVVASASSANIYVIVETGLFHLERIVVPDEVGKNFIVTDLKVGKNSQFISPGAIPASFFTESAFGNRALATDVLRRGHYITLSVTNASAKAEVFKGEIFGQAIGNEQSKVVEGDRGNRLVVLGLGHTIVKLGSRSVIRLQSQVDAMFDRLELPPGTSSGLRVADLRVAGVSVMPKEGMMGDRLCFEPALARICDWIVVEVEDATVEEVLSPPAVPLAVTVPLIKRGFWDWVAARILGSEKTWSVSPIAPMVAPASRSQAFMGTLAGTLWQPVRSDGDFKGGS